MKNFKKFIEENYDVYIDKPMGFKKPEEDIVEVDEEDVAEEEQANEVRK
jgi:hypothetical protein